MNILTKISIVVLVVLALFTSVVFITHASVVANFSEKYNSEKAKAEINLMQANNAQVALLSSQQDNQRLKDELGAAKADANKAAQDSDTKILGLQGQLAAALRDASNQKATTDLLAGQLASLNDRMKLKDDELTAGRKEKDKMAEDLRQVTQQYQEASAQIERYAKQSMSDQERLTELQKQIEEMKSRGATVGAAGAAGAGSTERVADASDARYTGTVTSVKGDMAEINIGSSQGVKKGDKLMVYRGSQFVAYLKIEQVDATFAAGIVTDRKSDLAVNDKVTNKLQ